METITSREKIGYETIKLSTLHLLGLNKVYFDTVLNDGFSWMKSLLYCVSLNMNKFV